jgi:transcriptional regulator with XRE-family HTH domain
MNLVELAQRIKRKRLERELTLEQVATKTGQTRSWLSKVENFRLTPSLPALARVADALDVTLSELVEGLDRKPEIAVVRVSDRLVVERDRPSSETTYESLGHKRPSRVMDPFLLTVPPGASRRDAMAHEGEEFLIVMEGTVDLEYRGERLHLDAGDAAYFDANAEHRLLNPGEEPAKVLCVFHENGR